MDFWRGKYSFAKLANLTHVLEMRGNSYLSAAKARDVELHRAASEAGTLRESKHRPQVFEMDEQTQILAACFQLLQQLVKVTARDKKYKPKPWPTPETAADIVKRQDADRGHDDLIQEVVFLPREEFEAHVAEHRDKHEVVRHQPGT